MGSGDCWGGEFWAEGPAKAKPLKQIYNWCEERNEKSKRHCGVYNKPFCVKRCVWGIESIFAFACMC